MTDKKTGKKIGLKTVVPLFAALILPFPLVSCTSHTEPAVTVRAENRFETTLHAVTDCDYEPFSYIADDGSYAGFDVELIAEVANRLQMNLDFVLLDWTDANEHFKSGKADVFLNMETDSVVASRNMIATIPTIEKQYVVYGRREVSSAAELYGTRVVSLHRMSELGLDDCITYVDSYAEMFTALENGDFDFAICPIQVGNVFLQKLKLNDIRASYAVGHIYGAIALHTGDTELRDRINAVISDLWREGFIDRLDKKWISHRYQNVTLREMLAENPWIPAAFVLLIVILAALTVVLALQRRASREREAYTKHLTENLATINRQREELAVERDRAEASSRSKTLFLSNMSHDIRTPMNAIIGFTNLALKNPDDVKTNEDYLKKIRASSDHLLSLINDVLEMSRIESGKIELEESPCNVQDILNDLGTIITSQTEAKKQTLTMDAQNVTNPNIICDKLRLNQILLNLLSNATKYTPEGGTISVRIEQKRPVVEPVETTTANADFDLNHRYGTYTIHVKDNGIGMSSEFAGRVFDAFEREKTSTVSGIQGTGLGMAITKRLVELMGGTISVQTEQGRGTEFIVSLTFKLCEEAEKTENTAANTDFTGKRILLVDDMDVNREIANMLLEMHGFTVEQATNGKEAVEKVAAADTGYYDAVLMDIQMPVMNGYEATKEIRALTDTAKANVPIIAMTANAFAEDVQKSQEAGMNAHISKPIDEKKVIDVLSQILGK